MTLTTALAAVLALSAPNPPALLAEQSVPYTSVAPQGGQTLSPADAALFRQGLASARARDVAGTQAIIFQINDPTARKLVEWALIDTSAQQLSYDQLAAARSQMAQWPREDTRNSAAERALDFSSAGPQQIIEFFGASEPTTIHGAIALAGALESSGRQDEAQRLIRNWWTTRSFEEAQQTRIYNRWSGWLTQDDHAQRLNMLLLGPHGPATRAMIAMVSPDRAAVASAAMTLRGAYSPDGVVAGLTMDQANDPNVVFERVKILRAANRQSEAFALLSRLPAAPSHQEGQDALWSERRNLFLDALSARNYDAAYHAMAGHGFPSGERKVDAEFFAGWVALTRLGNPALAAQHFEVLRQSSQTPITQGRALYWLGRAAEAQGDAAGARAFYEQGSRHIQTFYGQLAAEKAGMTTLTLPGDPAPTDADVAAFEGNDLVRAMRILADANEMTLYRVFAYRADDNLPDASQLALLMDMTRGYGETFTAMMVGRAASQRGFLMPERQYPIRMPPSVSGAAPLPFTLAITRQESSFDPRAQSHADARGMMQFLPSTARGVARQLGMSYSAEQLWDPDYNMTLGSFHLGDLMGNFGGSYLLTAVAYNAGPARPPQWTARCGDPRGSLVDPPDFIECAPFTETRNYMMRVMENMAVYKARLNGGSAPLTTTADIAAGVSPNSGPRPYQP